MGHSLSCSVQFFWQLLLTGRVISSLDFKRLIQANYLEEHCQKMPNFECKKSMKEYLRQNNQKFVFLQQKKISTWGTNRRKCVFLRFHRGGFSADSEQHRYIERACYSLACQINPLVTQIFVELVARKKICQIKLQSPCSSSQDGKSEYILTVAKAAEFNDGLGEGSVWYPM